jgi:hypothetical protein
MNARTVAQSSALILILVAATACATDPDLVPAEEPQPTRAASIGVVDQSGMQTTEPSTEALPVAAAFADAWVRTDLSDEAWGRTIYPLCTPSYGALLLGHRPAAAKQAARTTDPVEVRREPGQRVYDVGTDVGTLTITVVAMDVSWRVNGSRLSVNGREIDAAQPKPDSSEG